MVYTCLYSIPSSFRQKKGCFMVCHTKWYPKRAMWMRKNMINQEIDYIKTFTTVSGSIIHLRFFLLANLRCHPFFCWLGSYIPAWKNGELLYNLPMVTPWRVACGRQRLLFIQGRHLQSFPISVHIWSGVNFSFTFLLRRHSHSCKVKRKSFWCLNPFHQHENHEERKKSSMWASSLQPNKTNPLKYVTNAVAW